jgi:hypothetical protein
MDTVQTLPRDGDRITPRWGNCDRLPHTPLSVFTQPTHSDTQAPTHAAHATSDPDYFRCPTTWYDTSIPPTPPPWPLPSLGYFLLKTLNDDGAHKG